MPVAIFGATNSSPTENTSLAESSKVCNKNQSQNVKSPAVPVPYIHPLVRGSTMWMSQKSLEMCTESLGSETGSNDFEDKWFPVSSPHETKDMTAQQEGYNNGRREPLSSVNYHSTVRRSPPGSFPPPLPSVSNRDGPCIQMKPHRVDGRLVVTAIPVPPRKYLHAHRHDGRLVLAFIHTTSSRQSCSTGITFNEPQAQPKYSIYNQQVKDSEYGNFADEDEELVEDEDEEEEVEVLDRGTIVEIKVSSQPQQRGAIKVLRSSIVINKFVGGAPQINENRSPEPPTLLSLRRMVLTTTPAVAAAVAASSVSATPEVSRLRFPVTENKLLFTTKRRNREEMLSNVRRCIELRRPLFIWEQCCIAAS